MSSNPKDWLGIQLTGGRYRITARLGEGGMGFVYRADDTNLQSPVVIKVPRRAMLDEPRFAQRFQREIKSLVALSHPHIVKILDVGEHEGIPFAVMQYLDGGDLQARRRTASDGQNCAESPAMLQGWLRDVASALDFVHRQGYVHRDMKPENVLFDGEGHAYLGDFGVAKVLHDTESAGDGGERTGTGMVLGTPGYMAPELIMGQEVTGRADQYALAVTVYDLLAGRPPFQGKSSSAILVEQATKKVPALDKVQPSVSAALSAVVLRGLAKEPHDRYSTCLAFAEALLEVVPPERPATSVEQQAVSFRPATMVEQSGVSSKSGALSADGTGRVRFTCPSCQRTLKATPKLAGRSVNCPKCNVLLHIADDLSGMTLSRPRAKTQFDSSLSTPVRPATMVEPPPVPVGTSTMLEATLQRPDSANPGSAFSINTTPTQTQGSKATREKVLSEKLWIEAAIGGVAFVLLIVGVGALWLHRETRLASALMGQRWDEALLIEPENVEALVGRSNQKLDADRPDIDAILSDIEKVELLDPSNPQVDKIKGKIYTLQAIVASEAGDIARSESKLQDAHRLEVDSEYLDRANKSLALAYANRAESAVASGNVAAANSDANKASLFDPELVLPKPVKICLAESQAREMVSAYEARPNQANRNAAVMSLRTLEDLAPQSVCLAALRENEVMATGELVFNMEDAIQRKTFDGFEADYRELNRLHPPSAQKIIQILSKLTTPELSKAPPSVITLLPRITNSIGMQLKLIASGTFVMGSRNGNRDEQPVHQVTFTKPLLVGTHEVTQAQYLRVIGQQDIPLSSRSVPVTGVSWERAMNFCSMLSALPEERAAGRTYRLPTEAEWEYACRAGTKMDYGFGNDKAELPKYAWCALNSKGRVNPVGLKEPNEWGLYDMHGNVWELCSDFYGNYHSDSVTDPTANNFGLWDRVIRGGSYSSNAKSCRSANRDFFEKDTSRGYSGRDIGFRVVCSCPAELQLDQKHIEALSTKKKPELEQLSSSDDASQTFLTALLQGSDEWTAYMHVGSRDKTLMLKVGDSFEVGSVKGTVVAVNSRYARLKVDGREFNMKPSENLGVSIKNSETRQ